MVNDLDNFYLQHNDEVNGCLLALRKVILELDIHVTAEWKYRMPFFCYKGKMFCYLWVDKVSHKPYIGFVEGKRLYSPNLVLGERARMKILFIEPGQDLPIDVLNDLLQQALNLYRSGMIKIK